MAPLISIITVTRNAKEALGFTLASIKSQTCTLYELIVIDGASTDGTQELAQNSGITPLTLISEQDHGIYDAMNKGLALAKGDYVMFLNAGDSLASPNTLQQIADVMVDDDYPGIVYGQTQIVDPVTRRVLGPRHLQAPEILTLKSFANGMVVCHQAFVALRKLTPNFDRHYRFSADYDWCIKVLQRSQRNAYVPHVLIDYAAAGATTANRRKSLMERFRIMSHYYGLPTAIGHHIRFIPRFLSRQKQEKKWNQQD